MVLAGVAAWGMRLTRPTALLVLALVLLFPAAVPGQDAGTAPEPASGPIPKPTVLAERHMVVAAHPLAVAAGREVLRRGGSAVDAAIATQLVLGVVEPQSSGLGGGGFLLVAPPGGPPLSLDGRETAPAAAGPDRFLDAQGRPLPFFRAFDQGRAVGVPGLPLLLEEAHRRFGRLPWADLVRPALAAARDGVPAAPRLVQVLTEWREHLLPRPDLARLFYGPDGAPPVPGQTVIIPGLAEALKRLADQGAGGFYAADGVEARALLDRLDRAAGPDGPPVLTAADLAGYRVVQRPPVCRPYRSWRVCSMGPPSAGGIAVLQILGLLEGWDLAALGPQDPRSWHLLAEAGRLAYADRAVHVADPDFVAVPVDGLLSPAYLAGRRRLIDPARARTDEAPAGIPPWREGRIFAPGLEADLPSTTHISVVDGDGMVVALTSSVEFAFGSGLAAGGVILNNQLTDFSFIPNGDGRPVANAVAGGKRPRSSMAPTIVFESTGRPVLVLGSPGGTAIIAYVAQALVAILDWGMDPAAALALPQLTNRNGDTNLEPLPGSAALAAALESRGHRVTRHPAISGVHAIRLEWGPDGTRTLLGAADPRRDGIAAGD